ncbi:MAG: extracellular solute-binding protein, partial [Clostridiaceae bacterium]
LIIIIFTMVIEYGNKKNNVESKYYLAEDEKLVVFTSHKEEVVEPIIKEFEEKTGIWVEVVCGGTTDLLNNIKESDDKFVCDVMFGGSAESLENCDEYFLKYRCSEYDKLNSQILSKDYKWTAFSNLPIVIIYNNKTVYPTSAPNGWMELLSSKWEGKVAFAEPQNSGSSYTAIAALLQFSDKENEEIIDNLIKQIGGDEATSSGAAVDQVSNGIKQVGITLEATAQQRIVAGENISIVYPIEGTVVLPDGTAILKNAKHIENAKKFIEFTVSKETQEMVADRFYRRPVREDIDCSEKIASDILTMKFDVDWASKNKDNILNIWNKKMQ